MIHSSAFNEVFYIKEQRNFEEKSLALRLSAKGYKIVNLNTKMYVHYNYKAARRSHKKKLQAASFYLGESFALLWKQLYKEYSFTKSAQIMRHELIFGMFTPLIHLMAVLLILLSAKAWLVFPVVLSYFALMKYRFFLPKGG